MLLGGATLGQGLLVWRRPCGWALAVNQVDAGRACASVFRDDELDGRAEHTVLSFFRSFSVCAVLSVIAMYYAPT